jgi:hypothetical protein
VPLSGAMRGRFAGDVSLPLFNIDRRVEVKVRGHGFAQLCRWLADSDFLVVKVDRREPLVVLRLKFGVKIAAAAERAKNESQNAERNSARLLRRANPKSYANNGRIAPGGPGKTVELLQWLRTKTTIRK